MADEKVYTPEVINETPFPNQSEGNYDVSQSSKNDTYSAETIKDNSLPVKKVAYELLSSALNTRSKRIIQEFQFTKSGALQIGDYQQGINGDIRISPNGIVARDSTGSTTFALDGETGDAVFAGTIQTGTLISGLVVVGNNTWIIDGDPNTPRFLLYNSGIPQILIGERG